MGTTLSMEEMSTITGGGKFWDGFCAAIGLGDAAVLVGLIAATPVTLGILATASLGCTVYFIATQNN